MAFEDSFGLPTRDFLETDPERLMNRARVVAGPRPVDVVWPGRGGTRTPFPADGAGADDWVTPVPGPVPSGTTPPTPPPSTPQAPLQADGTDDWITPEEVAAPEGADDWITPPDAQAPTPDAPKPPVDAPQATSNALPQFDRFTPPGGLGPDVATYGKVPGPEPEPVPAATPLDLPPGYKANTGGTALDKVLGPDTGMLTGTEAYESKYGRPARDATAPDRGAGIGSDAIAGSTVAVPAQTAIPGSIAEAEDRLAIARDNLDVGKGVLASAAPTIQGTARGRVTALEREVKKAEAAVEAARKRPLDTQTAARSNTETGVQAVGSTAVQSMAHVRGLLEVAAIREDAPFPIGNPELSKAYKKLAADLQKTEDETQNLVDRSTHPDPAKAEDFSTKMTAGAVSMGIFMAGGVAARAIGVSSAIGSAGMGALQMGGDALREVEGEAKKVSADIKALKDQGLDATKEEARLKELLAAKYVALFANSGLGATEAIPIERFLHRLDAMPDVHGRVAHILSNTAKQSIEEVLQEVGQQISQNVVAKVLWDHSREIFGKDVTESGEVGGALGAIMGFGAGARGAMRSTHRANIHDLPTPPPAAPLDTDLTTAGTAPTSSEVPPSKPAPTPAPPTPGAGPSPSTPPTSPSSTPESGAPPSIAGVPQGAPPNDAADITDVEHAIAAPPALADTYERARDLVRTDGKASTSYIQRKLGLGYGDAARIMDRLEAEGIVGPADHAGKREILPEQATTAPSAPVEGTRKAPIEIKSDADIERIGDVVRQDHSAAQGEAHNVQHEHADWHGMGVTIEAPAGGIRRGTAPDGTSWEQSFTHPYGYLKGTKGADGMEVDAYVLGAEPQAFVLDELDENGKFRQHKVFLGAVDSDAARAAYLGTQNKKSENWGGGRMMTADEFNEWKADPANLTKPVLTDRNRQSGEERNKILRAYGYSQFQIDRMGEKERINEMYAAVKAGVKAEDFKPTIIPSTSNEGGKRDTSQEIQEKQEISPISPISQPAPEDVAAIDDAMRAAGEDPKADKFKEMAKRGADIYAQHSARGLSHADALRASVAESMIDSGLLTEDQARQHYGPKVLELLQTERGTERGVREQAGQPAALGTDAAHAQGAKNGGQAGQNSADRPGGKTNGPIGEAAPASGAANGRGNLEQGTADARREQATSTRNPEGFFDRPQEDVAPKTESKEAQYVIPGAERISMKEHLERKAREPKRAPKRGSRVKSRVKEIEANGDEPPSGGTVAPQVPKAPKPPAPMSAMTYLASRGGLIPNPDLKKIGLDYRTRVVAPGMGWRNVLRRDGGMTMDEAREALIEGKYLSNERANTPSDADAHRKIYEMLSEEHNHKRPTYAQGEENADVEDRSRREAKAGNEEISGYEDEVRAMLDATDSTRHIVRIDHFVKRAAYLMATEGLDVDTAWDLSVMTEDIDTVPTAEDEIHEILGLGDIDDLLPNIRPVQRTVEAPAQVGGDGEGPKGEAEVAGSGERVQGERQESGVEGSGQDEVTKTKVPVPSTEKTAAGEQFVLPGTEKISGAEQAQRGANKPLKPKADQKPADHGLFGDTGQQTDLPSQSSLANQSGKSGTSGNSEPTATEPEKAPEPSTAAKPSEDIQKLSAPVITEAEATRKLEEARQLYHRLKHTLDGMDKRLETPIKANNSLDQLRLEENRKIAERNARNLRKKVAEALDAVDDARAVRDAVIAAKPATAVTADKPKLNAAAAGDEAIPDFLLRNKKSSTEKPAETQEKEPERTTSEAEPEKSSTDEEAAAKWWKDDLSLFGRSHVTNAASVPERFAKARWKAIRPDVQAKLAAVRGTDKDPMMDRDSPTWAQVLDLLPKKDGRPNTDIAFHFMRQLTAGKVTKYDDLTPSQKVTMLEKFKSERELDARAKEQSEERAKELAAKPAEPTQTTQHLSAEQVEIKPKTDEEEAADIWGDLLGEKPAENLAVTNTGSAPKVEGYVKKAATIIAADPVRAKGFSDIEQKANRLIWVRFERNEWPKSAEDAIYAVAREAFLRSVANKLSLEAIEDNMMTAAAAAAHAGMPEHPGLVIKSLETGKTTEIQPNGTRPPKPKASVDVRGGLNEVQWETIRENLRDKGKAVVAGATYTIDHDHRGFYFTRREGNKVETGPDTGRLMRLDAIDAAMQRVTNGTPAPKAAPKLKAEPSDWTEIGKSADGRTLYQDHRRVRSYVEDGIRHTEPVSFYPSRAGTMELSVDRTENPEWKTANEHEYDRKQAAEKAYPPLHADTTGRVPQEAVNERVTQMIADGFSPVEAQAKISKMIRAAENPTERTAGEAAKSAVKNVSRGTSAAVEGLFQLFNTKNTLGAGLTFDEETWAKAKPFFIQATKDFTGAFKDMREFAQKLFEALKTRGLHIDDMRKMQPYLERFTVDVKRGNIDLRAEVEAPTSDSENNSERTGPQEGNQGEPNQVPAEGGSGNGSEGDSGRGHAGAGDRGAGPNGESAEAGVHTGRGEGSGQSGVSKARGTGRGSRVGAGRTGANGKRVPRKSPGADQRGREPGSGPVAPEQAPSLPSTNFRITDEVNLGEGGEATKFRDNLAAIDTLKEIEREQRRATPDEQRILARYVGWGGLANAFRQPETQEFKPDWKAKGEQLEVSLTKEELRSARSSTQYAHYTSRTVIDAMWNAVKQMGFAGGITIETSAGTGNFLGLVPEDIAGQTKFIAVEKDGISARIAQLLYPQETVLHAPFEAVPLPDGEAVLVIGNPPFSQHSLMFQNKPELTGMSMHNQFLLAGLDALRPGGMQAVVVSRYVMDAMDTKAREMMAVKAKLLGAIRLPDMAFKENARTEVVTDILFFQRHTKTEEAETQKAIDEAKEATRKGKGSIRGAMAAFGKRMEVPIWIETSTVKDPLGGADMVVNNYFAVFQRMIVGRLERSGTMYAEAEGKGVNVKFDGDLKARLAEMIAKFPDVGAGLQHDVLAASLARHEAMSESLSIALAGSEVGHVERNVDGKLTQVSERETPSGDYELTRRVLSPSSPWSRELSLDKDGRWYAMEPRSLASALDERIATLQNLIKGYDANGDISLAYAAKNELAQVQDQRAKAKPDELAKDGKRNIYVRKFFPNNEVPASMRLGENKYERLVEAVNLRDLTKRQLTIEAEDAPSAQMEGNRRKLAAAYNSFVGKHGLINDPRNMVLINDLPDGAVVMALEFDYRPAVTNTKAARSGEKARPASATPAPILSRRVVPKYEPATSADSAADAVSIVLSESGRLDMERIASLIGTDEAGAIEKLTEGEKPLAYLDPETKTYEPRNAYLSGQVAKKLAAARVAGLTKNAEDLKAVLPERWTAENVTAIIGNNWIPPEVYANFANHLLGTTATAHYSKATNAFALYVGNYERERQDQWGTPDMPADAILRGMLNSKVPKVLDPPDDNGTRRVNQELSTLVMMKAREIENEFADWVFRDGDRRNQLVDIYNDKFNTRVTRQHDGSHLTLPGKVPDEVIKLRRHQMNAVWRGVYERFMLLDHVVGAGKTYTAIARAMERRRMGLSRKPMVAVPNHLVEQWTQDVYRLYPGAKVLAAGRNQFDRKNRRRLFARIATGDWDLVIVPHSSFGFIGIDPATELRFLEQDLKLAVDAVREAKDQAAAEGVGGRSKPFTVKEAEKLVESITARMEKLKIGNKDRMLTFEQMGVDDLTVDECFPHDTPILTDRGWIPIGDVVENRLPVTVASYNKESDVVEWKPVIRWVPIRRKKTIVRVAHERGHFTCTADHKVWTDRGYVQAQALIPSDHLHVVPGGISSGWNKSEEVRGVFTGDEDLRAVLEAIQFPKPRTKEQRQTPLLQHSMCSEMAQQPSRTGGEVQRLDGRKTWGLSAGQKVTNKLCADEGQQPHEHPRDRREDAFINEGADVLGEGRKFYDNETTAIALQFARPSDGVCYSNAACMGTIPKPAKLLQGGLGVPGTSFGYRGGRQLAQNQEVAISGPPKNIRLERARVVGVEILEPRSDDGTGESGGDYSTVYDIEVADNHNFIAAGVLVSNCHEFKNLFYSSRLTGVRGMGDKAGSKKAFDLYNKVRTLRESPNGTVTFMTGTPISNSAVEMFTILRYLAANDLKDLGLEHFDAWRSQYVSAQPAFEPTEAGGLKEVTRLGRSWSNMRSLMELYYSFTDAVSQDDINKWHAQDNNGARFPVPRVKGGGRQEVVVKPTPAQLDELGGIVAGFNMLPEISDPRERNVTRLKLMDRARKVSLDVRAANKMSDSKEEGGKLDQIADQVTRIHKAWSADKGTQLIFLDRGVKAAKSDGKRVKEYDELVAKRDAALAANDEDLYRNLTDKLDEYDPNEMAELRIALQGGWNAYDQLKENLIRRGVPENEIRFVQEANSDAEKRALFDLVREGSVRVLIGSTPKMGAGTNVQRRLVALHHADVTWKPSDIEQREGRIIRQSDGNPTSLMTKYGDKFEVEILAYATERTVDAKMWDLNSQKLRTINGIRKYNGEFNMEFEDEDAVGMAEIAALASGDPLLLERVKLISQLDKLEMLDRAFRRRMFGIDDRIQAMERAQRDYPAMIKAGQQKAEIIQQAKRAVDVAVADRSVTVEGKKYDSMMDAVKAATDAIELAKGGDEKARYAITVNGQRLTNKTDIQEAIENAIGDVAAFEVKRPNGETWRRRSQLAKELSTIATNAIAKFEGDFNQHVGGKIGTMGGLDLNWGVDRGRWGDVVSLWLEHDGITLADGEKTVERGKTKQDVSTQLARSIYDNLRERAQTEAAFTGDYLQGMIDEANAKLAPTKKERAEAKFPQAEEMAATRKRLEEVIRTLDERTKAEEGRGSHAAPPTEPLATFNQPESIFSLNREYNVERDADGKVVAKPAYVFNRVGFKDLGAQAQRHVLRRGVTTGLEHLVAIDQRGQDYSFVGNEGFVGLSPELEAALHDNTNAIVIHHNHPGNNGFSVQDISMLGMPGTWAVWAHGHRGTVVRAALTPSAKRYFGKMSEMEARQTLFNAGNRVKQGVVDLLQRAIIQHEITIPQARLLDPHVVSLAFERAGLIEYDHNIVIGKDALVTQNTFDKLGLDAYISASARIIQGMTGHAQQGFSDTHDRPSGPVHRSGERQFDHVGETGTLFTKPSSVTGEPAPKRYDNSSRTGFREGEDFGPHPPLGFGASRPRFFRPGAHTPPLPMPHFTPLHSNWRAALRDPTLSLTERYSAALGAMFLPSARKLWDKLIDLARMQRAAEIFNGAKTPQRLDAHLAAILYPGITGERLKDASWDLFRPIYDAMKAHNVSPDEIQDYLYARHAEERNMVVGAINQPGHQFRMAMTDHSLVGASGMSTDEANSILAHVAMRQSDFDAVAALVDAVNVHNQNLMETEGLEHLSTIMTWNRAYQHYVPLRGEEVGPEDEHGSPPLGKGFSTRGPESMRALGRGTRAGSILAHLLDQTNRLIIRAEKNKVAKTFARWAIANPNPDLYKVGLATVRRAVNPSTGMVELQWVVTPAQSDRAFAFKVAGDTHYIEFAEGQEGMLLALKNLGIPRFGALMRTAQWMTRTWSSFQTAKDPEFVTNNFLRDIQEAGLALTAEQQAGFQAAYWKNLTKGRSFLAAVMGQVGATGNRYGQLYEDWRHDGGKISSFGWKDVDTIVKDIQREMTRRTESMAWKVAAQPWRTIDPVNGHIVHLFEALNDIMESTTRLAVYAAGRDIGLTRAVSAAAARAMTVDFSRGGEAKGVIQALWAFSNPAIQGQVNLVRRLKSRRFRYIYGSAIPSAAFMLTLYNLWASPADDDDEKKRTYYEEMKQWDRDQNIVLFVPGNKDAKKISLNFMARPAWALGENAAMAMMGKIKLGEAIGNFIGSTAQAFNPLGSQGSAFDLRTWGKMVSPTFLDPILELGFNSDWLNRPIHPNEANWNRGIPHSQQSKMTTSTHAEDAAQGLNRMTGGSTFTKGSFLGIPTDLYPDDLEYAWNFMLGGYGKFVLRGADLIRDKIDGVDTPVEKIPFVRRFITEGGSEQQKRETYYERHHEADEQSQQVRNAIRAERAGKNVQDAQKTIDELGNKVGARVTGVRNGVPSVSTKAETAFRDADHKLTALRTEERELRRNRNMNRVERMQRVKTNRKEQLDIMRDARDRYQSVAQP